MKCNYKMNGRPSASVSGLVPFAHKKRLRSDQFLIGRICRMTDWSEKPITGDWG